MAFERWSGLRALLGFVYARMAPVREEMPPKIDSYYTDSASEKQVKCSAAILDISAGGWFLDIPKLVSRLAGFLEGIYS